MFINTKSLLIEKLTLRVQNAQYN